jgi:hypothetical protein
MIKRQRQYIQSCNAVLAGTMDEEVQFLAQRYGLDALYLRLLIPLREISDTDQQGEQNTRVEQP